LLPFWGWSVTDPVSLTIGAGKELTEIADRLGILERLKRKLVKQPDVAAEKLGTVLFEISKIYNVLEGAANEYLSLWVVPDKDNNTWRGEIAKLRKLAAGGHEVAMRRAKGNCKKIWNIYIAYLQPWFAKALTEGEAEKLFGLFRELSDIDSVMVDAIDATAKWLTEEASGTLKLAMQNSYDAAQHRIQAAWYDWQPAASRIRKSMNSLYDLQASFVELARPV
jgi:hypothetical protein